MRHRRGCLSRVLELSRGGVPQKEKRGTKMLLFVITNVKDELLKEDSGNKKKEAFHLNCLCTILNPHSCKVKWTPIGKPDSIKSL